MIGAERSRRRKVHAQSRRISLTSQWWPPAAQNLLGRQHRGRVTLGPQHPGADLRFVEAQTKDGIVELADGGYEPGGAVQPVRIGWLRGRLAHSP